MKKEFILLIILLISLVGCSNEKNDIDQVLMEIEETSNEVSFPKDQIVVPEVQELIKKEASERQKADELKNTELSMLVDDFEGKVKGDYKVNYVNEGASFDFDLNDKFVTSGKSGLELNWSPQTTDGDSTIELWEWVNSDFSDYNAIVLSVNSDGKGGIFNFRLVEKDGDAWAYANSELLGIKDKTELLIPISELTYVDFYDFNPPGKKGNKKFEGSNIDGYLFNLFLIEGMQTGPRKIHIDKISLI